jgi:hypothetical protein
MSDEKFWRRVFPKFSDDVLRWVRTANELKRAGDVVFTAFQAACVGGLIA